VQFIPRIKTIDIEPTQVLNASFRIDKPYKSIRIKAVVRISNDNIGEKIKVERFNKAIGFA